MASELCAGCNEPLLLEIEPNSDSDTGESSARQTIPDDVELSCGCHFHWECLLEAYTITECPNCAKDISSLSDGKQEVLCTVRNEGGEQKDFDILPSATEEAYLRTYPEERKGHAYLEFCREGDVDAIVHLFKDSEQDSLDEDAEEIDLLRYQGTFEGIEGSGLHVAIRNNQIEVAWLLLVLGSTLEWSQFPAEVLHAMQGSLNKEDRSASPDIRSLEDSTGRTPAAVARQVGGHWVDWIKSGRLSV